MRTRKLRMQRQVKRQQSSSQAPKVDSRIRH
jgi:hypothetical protein